ncbi:MAG: hypothetical protein JWN14_3367 [Chthonomonadales bacterium]|nr:hypothetical protein [Chthonomonadales bacterium]
MAQRTGRVSCSRCGANNFDTVTACWKCGTALSSAPVSMPVMASAAPMAGERPAPVFMPPVPSGNPALAKRAALALALTIPFLGLPIGWAFMMIEDTRRQAIGRFCVNWSLVGLVLHLFLSYLGMQALVKMAVPLLAGVAGGLQNSRQGGSPDSALPKIPDMDSR